MVEHDLAWHRLTADSQAMVERHSVRCSVTLIWSLLATQPIAAARGGRDLLPLRSLIAPHHFGCSFTQPVEPLWGVRFGHRHWRPMPSMMSRHVPEYLKSGPIAAHTTTITTAAMKTPAWPHVAEVQ